MAVPLIGVAHHDAALIRLLDQVLVDAGLQTARRLSREGIALSGPDGPGPEWQAAHCEVS
jgi:hypothetical protein